MKQGLILHENRIPDWKRLSRANRKENLKDAILLWHRELVENVLSGQRSGKIARIPGTKRYYRQSVAGEPPAVRTGVLKTSYRPAVVSDKEAQVGSHLDYALFLEFGTRKMEPRPHLQTAYMNRRGSIRRLLSRRWDR